MKRIWIGATLLVAGIVGVAGASPVSATEDPPDKVCDGTHIPGGNATSVKVVAPAGQLISGYCVKAGSVNQGLGPEYVTLDPAVKEFTITYTLSATVKEISHYVVTYVAAPTLKEVTPVKPTSTIPTCEVPGTVQVLADTGAYTYNYSTVAGVTTVTVTATAGNVLVGDSGPWTFPITQLTGEACDDEVASNPPVPPVPPVNPANPSAPVVPPAAPTVASSGGTVTAATPVVGSAGPLPAQAVPTQALPATGTSSWVLAFIAMTLVLVGSGFVSFSRRFS